MVNSEQFAHRLQEILEYYDLSAAGFAEAIEVGRSSISHILSGRNKPSLDFVLKVVQTFPEVELYWLLNGKGKFPALVENKRVSIDKQSPDTSKPLSVKKLPETPPEERIMSSELSPVSHKASNIKKIVIFYNDGSFEVYQN